MLSSPTMTFADTDDLHKFLEEIEHVPSKHKKKLISSMDSTDSDENHHVLATSLSSGAGKLKFDWLRTNMRTLSAPRLLPHVKPPSWSFQKLDSYSFAPLAVSDKSICFFSPPILPPHPREMVCCLRHDFVPSGTGLIQRRECTMVCAGFDHQRKGPAAARRVWCF